MHLDRFMHLLGVQDRTSQFRASREFRIIDILRSYISEETIEKEEAAEQEWGEQSSMYIQIKILYRIYF